jgi:signal transduction histidine kinase
MQWCWLISGIWLLAGVLNARQPGPSPMASPSAVSKADGLATDWAAEDVSSPFAATAEGPRVLTRAAQVRALTPETAGSGLTVRLRGVVLMGGGGNMTVSDETAAVFLVSDRNLFDAFRPGDVIDLEGVTDPGKFAPVVEVTRCQKVGEGPIPEPLAVTCEDLLTGRWDAQWVEVSGVVRRCGPGLTPEPNPFWELILAGSGGRLTVRLHSSQGEAVGVDAEVRLRGVCFYQFNKERQVLRPILSMAPQDRVMVVMPPPTEPYGEPLRTIKSLTQFNPKGSAGHRVRVRGSVTHAEPERGFWIRDAEQGLHVSPGQAAPLAVGDELDVLGFLARGVYPTVLEDAEFRRVGRSPPPIPTRLQRPAEALQRDGDLVELDATLEERWLALDGCRLKLRVETNVLFAVLRKVAPDPIPTDWQAGSQVRVAGICVANVGVPSLDPGMMEPQSIELILRSPADLRVLRQPPWWTPEHAGWVLAGVMGLLLLLGSGLAWGHRRRATRQMAWMKAQAALAEERARIARDLHDEIGANLTHISILSTVAAQPTTEPQTANRHSIEAANVAQQTIRAFDEILWSINPKNDTLRSLSHYICRYAEETLAPAGVRHRFDLDESFPALPLPPHCRHGMLLAVKETLNNVLKHAAASRVEIRCGMESGRVFLVRVTDDGRGFDRDGSDTELPRRQGLGLENLQRRLEELGGECHIESRFGHGTQVTFRLPL